jgi:hypothetical protein
MRAMMNMTLQPISKLNIEHAYEHIQIPPSIPKWLYIKQMPPTLCVQDTVHIGVKLKSRLLKPSIILPMGSYIATSSHLQILAKTFGKASHGLRWKDLNQSCRAYH